MSLADGNACPELFASSDHVTLQIVAVSEAAQRQCLAFLRTNGTGESKRHLVFGQTAIDAPKGEEKTLSQLAVLYAATGRIEEARRTAEIATEMVHRVGVTFCGPRVLAIQGSVD